MPIGEALLYGVIAGIVGGIAQGMLVMAYTMMARSDVLLPLKEIGAFVTRPNWETTGSAAVGLVIHMMFTAALGAAFGLLVVALNLDGLVTLAIVGMVVGLIDWVIARFLVLPAIDPVLLDVFATPMGLIGHLMYGLVLGVVFALL